MNYTVQKVLGHNDWPQDAPTVRYWMLQLDGVEGTVSLGQKPIDKPPPAEGETLDLELTPDAKFPGKFKAKRAGGFGGGGGPRPMDPKQIAGMQRAHAQEMGLRYAAIRAEKEMLPE